MPAAKQQSTPPNKPRDVLPWDECKFVACVMLQGILARCMQRTSNVPLWRLYAKQECCPGPSSDLEYEREIMVRLTHPHYLSC